MKERKTIPATPAGPLTEFDWNFDAVPNEEFVACCYWEYARESVFIRDVRRRCSDPRLRQMANRELWEFVGNDIDRIQSIGYANEVFVSGWFLDQAKNRKRHKGAWPISGRFPAPWQSLPVKERKYRSRIRKDREVLRMIPFKRGYAFFAEDIARWCRSQRDETQHAGKEIRPSLFHVDAEVGVFQIEWGVFTNDEIADGFRKWVKANRPPDIPKPSGQGHKPKDWRAHLVRLAVMRLLSKFTAFEIVNGNEFPPLWKAKQFSGSKWQDINKWYDARRQAEQTFRRLFPFLPPNEKPLSYARQAAA